MGDDIEGKAIDSVFNSRGSLQVSSTKGATGHLLGAAGAVEAAFTALSVCRDVVPATLNLNSPSSNFGWSHVTMSDVSSASGVPVKAPLEHAVCNSFGFGGTNASLCFSKCF